MTQRKIPYTFNECITTKSPFIYGDQDFVRIYAVEDEIIPYTWNSIVMDYLDAAERLIQSVYSSHDKPNAKDDGVALPILHLYSHALEVTLKMLIKIVDHHAEECNRLIKEKNHKKILENHDLGKLISVLKAKIPIKLDNLHYFKEFQCIAHFIEQFARYGIDSVTTRYISGKNKVQISDLHKKHSYLKLRKMHASIAGICSAISEYVNGNHFYFCSCGDFSLERIDELTSVLTVMENNKDIFLEYEKNSLKYPTTTDERNFVVFDFINLEKIMKDKLSSLDDGEIARLALGFVFIYNECIRLGNLIRTDINIDTIIRKKALYQKAILALKEHIQYLKKYLN